MKTLEPQPTLVKLVYEAILAEIMQGRLGPEAPLVQGDIAKSLGVSRQPVQQALLLLRSQGILCNERGRLAVAPLDGERVRNLYEVRAMLDGLACARVAERCGASAREEGLALIARGREAAASHSIAQLVAADMDFHFFLYRLSGNPMIAETCAPHWNYLRCVMSAVLLKGETAERIWDEHEQILAAVVEGDAPRAEQLARDHIAQATEVVTTGAPPRTALVSEKVSPIRQRRIA